MAYTTIDDPSAHFQTATYTGTSDDSAKVVTNDGNSDLQPDLAWIKATSGTYATRDHSLYDSSRGATLRIETSSTDAEATDSGNSFSSDGMTLAANYSINGPSTEYVGWQWKANGGSVTASASESGDNPAYSTQANTTAGFSIVTYTGTGDDDAQVTHSLGAVPDVIICKKRNDTGYWRSYFGKPHVSGYNRYLQLDQTNALTIDVGTWGNQNPTSSVFTLGQNTNLNADDDTYVAYCFTSIQGYSKFGIYTGNGNADGPFVYTGFKPSFLIAKETGAVRNWTMAAIDMQSGANITNSHQTNVAGAQDTNERMDWLSNGFKLRTTSTTWNTSSGTFAYMAFAKNPFVTSGGIPCLAH